MLRLKFSTPYVKVAKRQGETCDMALDGGGDGASFGAMHHTGALASLPIGLVT